MSERLPTPPTGHENGLASASRHPPETSIGEAAGWYASNAASAERPLIPALRRRFGLSAAEACAALAEGARLIRAAWQEPAS